MQQSPYSPYDDFYKTELEVVQNKCGLEGPTDVPLAVPLSQPKPKPTEFCSTARWYTTKDGDSCDSVALKEGFSSMELFEAYKSSIRDCSQLEPGLVLCLPHSCASVYAVKTQDTCHGIEDQFSLSSGSLSNYNTWLFNDCSNLRIVIEKVGKVICLGASGGSFNASAPVSGDLGRAGGRGS